MSAIEIVRYEIGKYYRVPIVYGEWRDHFGYWPVLGPWHEDAEHIGFEDEHYHVDARFLADKDSVLEKTQGGKHMVYAAFSAVICETSQWILTDETAMRYVGLRLRKCRRPWPGYPERIAAWVPKLEKDFADAELKSPICPHRGAPLDGLEVKDGCVTCPLHGLRWNCKTGKLAPRLIRELSLTQPPNRSAT